MIKNECIIKPSIGNETKLSRKARVLITGNWKRYSNSYQYSEEESIMVAV